MEYIIEIGAILLASSLAMMLHELPKSIAYVLTGRHCQAGDRHRIFKLYQYIDPVGCILFLTCNARLCFLPSGPSLSSDDFGHRSEGAADGIFYPAELVFHLCGDGSADRQSVSDDFFGYLSHNYCRCPFKADSSDEK